MNNSFQKKTAHKRAVFFDNVAKWVINAGGFAVIIAVLGILIFIILEGLPLLFGADAQRVSEMKSISERILFTGIEENQKYSYVFTANGEVDIIDIKSSKLEKKFIIDELSGKKIYSLSADLNKENFVFSLDSGAVATAVLKFITTFDKENQKVVTPEFEFGEFIRVDTSSLHIETAQISVDEDGNPSIAAYNGENLFYYSSEEGFSLMGDGEKTVFRNNFEGLTEGKIKLFSLSNDGLELTAVNTGDEIFYISLADKEEPELIGKFELKDLTNDITAATFLIGNQSVILGDSQGNLLSFMKSRDDNAENGWTLQVSHHFEKMNSAVTFISSSSRNKNFIVGDKSGGINLYYLTSERLLLSEKGNDIPVAEVNFSPKANGYIALYADGSLVSARIENPHPEISFTTLFGKVLYEGYKDPDYVWQSTGGSDAFEPKMSMIPLLFGTIKGTIYAMLFAIPLALLGALYTSTFSHPFMKNKIKPLVEILAALPSVVIGFLAGLWLAPLLEKVFPGVILMFIVMPLIIVSGVVIWRNSERVREIIPRGYEILLIIPLLLIGGWLSIHFGGLFEQIVFGGDYRHWLGEYFNTNYDQRNSIVVGFAMGFAVIPIIFTIAEDSLSGVPQHLSSASLALGASKWQTAVRVVLPTASPGIFSAIMIGFGRAIGETMIVLMATGNTPIMSLSPFNGMRTLSANIAVEIPEAPYHGTLYRVLFISAALLFILTFIVNTVAEIVRQRLRKKYMHI